jgi:uncharacterized protein
MSRENVEIVRRSFEAFARGDFETAFAAHAPDTSWCTASDEPDQQTYRGLDGLRKLVASLDELWEGRFAGTMTFEDFIDRGDWVVVPWHARMHGRMSGIDVEVEETYAVRVREGKIVRVDEFRSSGQALEAVT